MDTNFQQILKIATDALSLKYSLEYSVFYWHESRNGMEPKASIEMNPGSTGTVRHLSVSESLMGAIRKPLIILKSGTDLPTIQIIIPLINNNQKLGMMAFWGRSEEAVTKDADRRFLDMIGLISLRVLLSLDQGLLKTDFSQTGLSETVWEEEQQPVFEDEDSIEPVDMSFREDEPEMQSFVAVEKTEMPDEAVNADEVVKGSQDAEADEVDFSDVRADLISEAEGQPAALNESRLEIEPLLAVIKIGFLVFDKTGQITVDNMAANSNFLDQPSGKKTALEVLFEWGNPINEDSASFDKHPKYDMILDLMQSVFSRITDIDVLKELLPNEIELEERSFRVEYHYVKSTESIEQDGILAAFTDISLEKELTAKCAVENDRANMIIKVALDIDGYYQYRQSTEKTLELIDAELSKPINEVQLEAILHHVQAIQGGAEIYEINELTLLSEELLTSLEQKIVSYTPVTFDEIEVYRARFNLLKDRFQLLQKQYLNHLVSDEQILDKAVYRNTQTKILKIGNRIINDVLKKQMEELEAIFEKNYKPFTRLKSLEDITQKRLNRIKEHIHTKIVQEGAEQVTRAMSDLRKQPIGLMLKRYAIIAVNLGERLQKRVEVEIKGADVEVPFHKLENLFTGLTFVIRNCVEHGLETMEERIALDKSLEGNIKIQAALESNMLRIVISDDGRGIDVNTIKRAALENHLITTEEADSGSQERILNLMFSKGFSTKKDSRGTFGRGVGLNAVGSSIEELGGDVSVQTKLKKGTIIKVEVPL